jgi:hypothetical protein
MPRDTPRPATENGVRDHAAKLADESGQEKTSSPPSLRNHIDRFATPVALFPAGTKRLVVAFAPG